MQEIRQARRGPRVTTGKNEEDLIEKAGMFSGDVLPIYGDAEFALCILCVVVRCSPGAVVDGCMITTGSCEFFMLGCASIPIMPPLLRRAANNLEDERDYFFLIIFFC